MPTGDKAPTKSETIEPVKVETPKIDLKDKPSTSEELSSLISDKDMSMQDVDYQVLRKIAKENNIEVPNKTRQATQELSLIHISEPTRPY